MIKTLLTEKNLSLDRPADPGGETDVDHRIEPDVRHRTQRVLADRLGLADAGVSAADGRTVA